MENLALCALHTLSQVLTTNLHVGFRGKEISSMAPNISMTCLDHKVIKFLNQYSNLGLLFYCTSFYNDLNYFNKIP